MYFNITRINKTVELDDELVKAYTKYKDLKERLFIIALRLHFGEIPEDITDKELSYFCNNAIIRDLNNMRDDAIVMDFIRNNEYIEDYIKNPEEPVSCEIKIRKGTNSNE